MLNSPAVKNVIKLLIRGSLALFVAILSLHIVVETYIYRDTKVPVINEHEKVWYFAYGSNMSVRYLSNVRDVEVYQSLGASLPDHKVTFSLHGIPFVEPSFVQIHPVIGEIAYGVIQKITREDLQRVVNSEGSAYSLEKVTLFDLNNIQHHAYTLIATEAVRSEKPTSIRYRNIMLEGAVENGLPQCYVDHLTNMDTTYLPIISELTGTFIHSMVIVTSL